MKFLIFDREENYISTLKDILEARHTEEINGEDTLELTTLDQRVSKGHKIAYNTNTGEWKEFVVKEVEESHTSDGIEKRIFCESSFYETWGDYIEDKRPTNTTASVALATALDTTRWEIGIVDDLGLNSTSFYRCSAKEAVQEVARTWQGEIRTRVEVTGNKITHRYVDLVYKRGGDYGRRFTYSKDLESVTKTVHRDDVITALYGYGKGEEVGEGHGRRIDFADINSGMAYVSDGYTWAEFEATYNNWTELESTYPNWRYINSKGIKTWGRNNPDGIKTHVFASVELDECEDKEELLRLTRERLLELSQPQITYEAKVVDMNLSAELGDTVAVIDREFTPELRLKARVIKITRDLLHPENNDIVLGNFIPNIADSLAAQQKYIDNFRSKQGVWDRSGTINKDGTINANFLNNLVDELNAKMNSQGGYVYISEDGQGLTTYNKPRHENPNMAIQLLGGAFRIANSKKPDGTWNWRTFGDGNGFVADSFIGGLLKGGKVHFDLTNGTLLIGNSTSDYTMYFDGTNLRVDGGTITGGVVRTSSGATRIELSDNLLRSYLNGVRRVQLDYDSLDFYNEDGAYMGNMAGIKGSAPQLRIVNDSSTVFLTSSMIGLGINGSGYTYKSINVDQDEILLNANARATDNLTVQKDFSVVGTKNRIVSTQNYDKVLHYALETPSALFMDIGQGLIDETGICYIDIESIFAETIDRIGDYHIQLTKYGEGDVWLGDKKDTYFIVKGTPKLKFAWEIKAKQKGYANERLEKYNRHKEVPETDFISLANEYLEEYEKELIV